MSWGDLVTSGAITNTVSAFVLQPQRTKHFTKRNSLDQLSETWIGPSVLEDAFVPAVGTSHSIYPLMTVISVEVRRYVQNCGIVSQVTLNYQGKMLNVPSGKYVSAPTYDTYWSEGEVSWEESTSQSGAPTLIFSGATFGPGSTTGITGAQFQWVYPQVAGVQQWSRRYIGRGVRIGYITNARPSGNPTQKVPKDALGFALVYDILGPFHQGAPADPIRQTVISECLCTDVSVSDSADGWYQVTETYQSRMYVSG